ncbi:MAG: hypothetical protein IT579_12445 [Verrucomicrobia subdivision 3 bacterium]|nr:hypothetical protein [Limisphaerales bacterium]
MKSPAFWKQALIVFLATLIGYAVVFHWIEHRRRTNGPWQVTFTEVAGAPIIVVNQPALRLTNITVVFPDAPTQTNLPRTVAFEHGRPAPFDLPFGKCIFADAIFLPGTATCEIFGHEIQLLPRTLTIDGAERPWRSGEKIFLTNTASATMRSH